MNEKQAENRKIAETFFKKKVRLESIIHLGSMCAHTLFPLTAREAFEDDWDDIWEALGLDPAPDSERYGVIAAYLYDNYRSGFLVEARTPVPFFTSPTSYTNKDFCCYVSKWFYAETSGDVMDKAVDWAQQYFDQERIRQGFGRPSQQDNFDLTPGSIRTE